MKTTVGLVQINNSFADACYFPYAVGVLQAWFQQYSARANEFNFLSPLYRRIPVDDAVKHLAGADIVAFSVSSWNFRVSLAIASRHKQRHPNALIIFGGPHIPGNALSLLTSHPAVNIVCHGEGEIPFTMILEAHSAQDWQHIPSISYLIDGVYVTHPEAQRITDLSLIPSPYLNGVFDPLLENTSAHHWLALWETNRGCPFSCSFCDWGAATKSKLYCFDMQRLRDEIAWFAQHRIEFIFCCDANFGILPRDLEIVAAVDEMKRSSGYPQALSVQNTKNADRSYEIQKTLADAGLSKGVNLALQSMNPETLRCIGRQNIPAEMFQDLQRRYAQDGIETFTDVIIGLPGETYASFTRGIARIIENGQYNRIQFINLSILPNAPMADAAYKNRHGLMTIENRIINIHGSPGGYNDGIEEIQQLVIGTATMPPDSWCRARAFSWMASLLFFDKLLQIPMILLQKYSGLGYAQMIEAFLPPFGGSYPIIEQLAGFFITEAERIQQGNAEFFYSQEWLGIFWPHDEYAYIRLSTEQKLDAFYAEAEQILAGWIAECGLLSPPWLSEAISVNRLLLKQPLCQGDLTLHLQYTILSSYQQSLKGGKGLVECRTESYLVDRSEQWDTWQDWCREVVWFCNKRGAYLYKATLSSERE
ncbi:MAG: radical SAM protein [Desulfuromonadales bacterium]